MLTCPSQQPGVAFASPFNSKAYEDPLQVSVVKEEEEEEKDDDNDDDDDVVG